MAWVRSGGNVLLESDFETWNEAEDDLVKWNLVDGHAGPATLEKLDVHGGDGAIKLAIDDLNSVDDYGGGLWYSAWEVKYYTLLANQEYVHTFWWKTNYPTHNTTLYHRVRRVFYTDDGTYLDLNTGEWTNSPTDISPTESGWNQFTTQFNTGEHTDYRWLQTTIFTITVGTTSTEDEYIILDDWEIYPVTWVSDDNGSTLALNTDSKTISIAEKTYVYTSGGSDDTETIVITTDTDSYKFPTGKWYRIYGDAEKYISGFWTSKRLDFNDQFPQHINMWKTVDKVRIEYVDETADTPITVSLSTDGGVTWISTTRLLGTGNGKQKSAFFYFKNSKLSTSKYFNIRVESVSNSTTFTWTGFYIYFEVRGEYFTV